MLDTTHGAEAWKVSTHTQLLDRDNRMLVHPNLRRGRKRDSIQLIKYEPRMALTELRLY